VGCPDEVEPGEPKGKMRTLAEFGFAVKPIKDTKS